MTVATQRDEDAKKIQKGRDQQSKIIASVVLQYGEGASFGSQPPPPACMGLSESSSAAGHPSLSFELILR